MKRRGLAIVLGAAILVGMLASIPHALTWNDVQAMTSFEEALFFEEIAEDNGEWEDKSAEEAAAEEGEASASGELEVLDFLDDFVNDEEELGSESEEEETETVDLIGETTEEMIIRPDRLQLQLTLEPGTYCGLMAHTHGAFCFDENSALICFVLEHEHDDSCFIDPDGYEPENEIDPETESWSVVEIGSENQSDNDENDAENDADDGLWSGFGSDQDNDDNEEPDNEEVTGGGNGEEPEQPEDGGDNEGEVEEEKPACGLDEHLHGDSCFDDDNTLICEIPAHIHDEDCGVPSGDVAPDGGAPEDGDDAGDDDTVCGLDEHLHGDDCYDEDGELICGVEEHVHTEDCIAAEEPDDPEAEEDEEPECDLDEHVHGAECHDENGDLICDMDEHVHDEEECGVESELPEITCELIEHTHGEGCFDEAGNLLCPLDEHVHDKICGGVKKETEAPKEKEEDANKTCGKEEHVHGRECCNSTGAIVCGKEEHIHGTACGVESTIPGVAGGQEEQETDIRNCGLNAHAHTDYCFDIVGNLICGMQEHAHSEVCDEMTPEQPEQETETEAICGRTEHLHSASCRDNAGNYICGIEEHMHGEACSQMQQTGNTPEMNDAGYLCEKAAHIHDETCYEEDGSLGCMLEEHAHDESCMNEAEFGAPVCEKTEHTHGDACYDEGGIMSCTLEEHTHGENCGDEQAAQTPAACEKAEHTHGDSCYDEAGILACQIEEHTHGENCGEAQEPETALICDKAEHTHGEGCYDEAGVLVCLTEEHTHGEACSSANETLSVDTEHYPCGKIAHEHNEDCFDAFGTVLCGMEEHIHTGDCVGNPLAMSLSTGDSRFDTTALGEILISAQISGGAEPYTVAIQMMRGGSLVQTDAMFASSEVLPMYRSAAGGAEGEGEASAQDGESETGFVHEMSFVPEQVGVYNAKVSVTDAFGQTKVINQILPVACDIYETREMWEATMADVVLTGDPRVDIVAIAQSQLGYTESTVNFILDESNQPMFYTRYGDWWGSAYADWCAMFVSFCLEYAGVTNVPMSAGTSDWVDQLSAASLFEDPDTYPPMAGDLVFFDRDGNGYADHVGIVESVTYNEETGEILLNTIEGNVGQAVSRRSYPLPCEEILGYGRTGKNVMAQRADNTAAYIGAIPSIEEIMAQYESLPEEEKDAYLQHMMMVVKTAYAYYEDLGPAYRPYVKNADRLFGELGSLMPMMIDGIVDHNVYQSNTYTMADTTIVSGGSPREVLGDNMGYAYWDALVVDQDPESGLMMITQYDTSENEKLDLAPATENGYVVLMNDKTMEIGEETAAAATFDYAQPAEYTSEGLGEMLFFTPYAAERALSYFRGADTSKFIDVNLFNYDDDANNEYYFNDHKYPGFQNPGGTTAIYNNTLQQWSYNFGDLITADQGYKTVTTKDPSGGTGDAIALINRTQNSANRAISGAMSSRMGDDGYPALANGYSLGYLWRNSSVATKQNRKSINYLFQYDEDTGDYYFDSLENHAQFDSSDDTFKLYRQLISSNYIMYPFGNFLPLNDIDTQATQSSAITRDYFLTIGQRAGAKSTTDGDYYDQLSAVLPQFVKAMDTAEGNITTWDGEAPLKRYFNKAGISYDSAIAKMPLLYSIDYDNPTNFFFGMDMEMTFMQPKNGITGPKNDQEMIFYFSGDDDVWVYIDDVLFLDLSGIHRHVGGEIDFVKGEVRYRDHDMYFADGLNYKTVKFSELVSADQLDSNGRFKDYSTHKFNFYYMERGSGSSVCRMNFNFPLLHKNSIVVSKVLTTNDNVEALGNPDFMFQVLNETKTGLFIAPNTEYKIYNGEDVTGTPIGTGKTDANGVFTLKAGQTAVFEGINENAGKYVVRELLEGNVYEQYGKITVSGQSTTTVNDVTVGNDTFTGVDSPVTDMSNGTTFFRFDNNFEADKLGGLSVVKKVDSEFSSGLDLDYTFRISLDGELLPVGTEYTVENEDGTTTKKTVAAEGEIVVKENQKATLTGILAGTKYNVEEILVNGEVRYDVVWKDENGEILSEYTSVDGEIPVSATTVAVATNKELGTEIKIPGTKAMSKYDGKEREYTFTLEKVTDAGGETVDTAFTPLTQTVKIADAAQAFEFAFDIGLGQYPEYPQLLYFRISETAVTNDTMYNDTVYIAEVKLEKVTQAITGEDGTQTTQNVANATLTGLWRGNIDMYGKVTNLEKCETISADFVNTLFDSLTIEKQVKGEADAQSKKFTFSVKLEAGTSGVTLPEAYTAYVTGADGAADAVHLKLGQDGMLTREDGSAITLGHDEKIVIAGIPYGAVWTVTEESVPGFHTVTSIVQAEGEAVNGSGSVTTSDIVIGGNVVTYTNVAGVELPHTGGSGTTHLYTLGGSLLAFAATLLLYKMRQRKEGTDGIC